MKWRLIEKQETPSTGTYSDWKGILAREANYQCVYCCTHESKFGGPRNFHVEHFKPKSLFKALTNDFHNLFYACAICNTFKGDDWPGDVAPNDFSVPGYHNPSVVDYSNLLTVPDSGYVESDSVAGRYLIERTNLNRPQLISLRLIVRFSEQIRAANEALFHAYKFGSLNSELKERALRFLFAVTQLDSQILSARPYFSEQTRRTA